MINSIYSNTDGDMYFPKSKVFLYPLLGMRKDSSIRPIDTYIAIENSILKEDRWLICTFYLRNDLDYRKFEKTALLGNSMFQDFRELDSNIGIYIFNFENYATDWDNFLKGKYSRFSPTTKDKIRKCYGSNNSNAVYIDSFINPKKYYPIYAKILNVPIATLEGGELCDIPDMDRETLKISPKENLVKDNSLNLPKS